MAQHELGETVHPTEPRRNAHELGA
jgi:hypothetical protein